MRSVSILASTAAVLLLAGAVAAQSSVPFPMRPAGTDPATGLPTLTTDAPAVRDLVARPEVVLTGFTMRSGASVDLELQQIDLGRLGMNFLVDGVEAPGLLEALDISIWTGHVAGSPESDVLLSFSNHGSRGWVQNGQELVHLMPQPGAGGSWADSVAVIARDEELRELGMEFDQFCGTNQIQDMPALDGRPSAIGGAGGASSGGTVAGSAEGTCSFWEAKIAIETDFQLFQVFGSLGAETSYVTTLLAAASSRYQEQIDTVLSYPYIMFYTTAADPWSTPDGPGSSSAMLNEFENAWQGSIPGGAHIGHFVSGAGLGGGIAYLGVLCDTGSSFSFAVSGNIDGNVPFPIAVGPLNWDFMVFTHETGHNFNSPHTHDYNPQIDNCAGGSCITNGTIMSYCHLCTGGLSNITTFFHPTVVGVMQAHAGACLPFFAPLVAQAGPTIVAPDTPTPLSVDVLGTPTGGVSLNYRFDPGDFFTVVAMADQGGGVWSGSMPGADCGEAPEWFFSTVDSGCGPYSTPTFTAEVGFETVVLFDELEVSSGWTAGLGGDTATTGMWTRGDPNGTAAQPENDHTPSGTDCFFTGQGAIGGGLGDNDVDGGITTLLTPTIDLSSGDAKISYWRWFSNDTGAGPNDDPLVIDISNNGGGSWTNVETVGPAGAGTSGGWIFHQFVVSDFVTPTANMQMRFIAADEGTTGSLVEAAIDDFKVFRTNCDPWVDLGGGTSGINGVPQLTMSGPLTPLSTVTLDMTNGAPSALSLVWFSFASTPAPFLGGTLHAFPINIQILANTNGAGALNGSATFPGGSPGDMIWVQVGVTDASVPIHGGSLSNGVKGTVP